MLRRIVLASLIVFACLAVAAEPDQAPVEMFGRTRVKDAAGNWIVQYKPLNWNPKQTAVIICDMWDDHYCRNSARRVAELAPVMNEVVKNCRQRGMLIIHCPSGCMDVYKDTPQRKLAQDAPVLKTTVPLKGWCNLDPDREGPLPIDASKPCDDDNPREAKRFYSRQIDALEIKPGDAVTDSAEAYYLMKQQGIKNAIIMGVHTNMCVLGRPFGIRQLSYQGLNVVLMRDMTDAMYNPALDPKVAHCRGTELVIEHIEKHWCPTIASTELTGRAAFRFKEDARPHAVFVVGGNEYDANATMPQLAHRLRDQHGLSCEVLLGHGKEPAYTMPGIDALARADLMVLFARRRALPREQLAAVRKYLDAGKPLVAFRTASHAFDVAKPPAGSDTWATFDKDVLGCDYTGHGPEKGADISFVKDHAAHPILKGIDLKPWHSNGSLYSNLPLAKDTTVLVEGSLDGKTQPQAFVRTYKGGRVFYTSLGHKDDFAEPRFAQLAVNACLWGLGKLDGK